MRRQLFILLALLMGLSASVMAQPAPRPFVLNNSQVVPIQSKITGRDHELVILLPASFATQPERRYPVLYFMDAYWDAPLLSATYGNLIYDNEVPEFIMVGLSYPTGANYGVERRIDFTPTAVDPTSGKGERFLEFIQKEVAPLIETRYRGEKTGRVIAGSSLGGLIALTAAYKAPGFFAGHIAISPATMWDQEALMKMDDAYAKAHKSLDARMFISYGSAEYPPFRDSIIRFQKHLDARKYAGLALHNYAMEGIDHASVKNEGYVRGLMWVWKASKPQGPSGLERAMRGLP